MLGNITLKEMKLNIDSHEVTVSKMYGPCKSSVNVRGIINPFKAIQQ